MSFQMLRDAFKSTPKAEEDVIYKYKTRFAMLGTVGAGKTTIASALAVTTQTLSATVPGFNCRILSGKNNMSLLQAASLMRRGYYPPKTPIDLPSPPEAGLLMRWKRYGREKILHVPICDLPGEELQKMSATIGTTVYPRADWLAASGYLQTYVKEADGFILVAPASQACIFTDDQRVDTGPVDVYDDPDIPLHEMLSSVIDHKKQYRGRPIKACAFMLTQWDRIADYAKHMDMDVYDPSGEGMKTFLDTAFPSCMALLKSQPRLNVAFFPSYILQKTDPETQRPVTWRDGRPRIAMYNEAYPEKPLRPRIPAYSEGSYIRLVKFLSSFAM